MAVRSETRSLLQRPAVRSSFGEDPSGLKGIKAAGNVEKPSGGIEALIGSAGVGAKNGQIRPDCFEELIFCGPRKDGAHVFAAEEMAVPEQPQGG